MGSTFFFGFSYPKLLLVFLKRYFLGTSSFILFFYLISIPIIVYCVCDSASEFGAMGSTSFEPYQFLFFSIRLTTTVIRNSTLIVHLY